MHISDICILDIILSVRMFENASIQNWKVYLLGVWEIVFCTELYRVVGKELHVTRPLILPAAIFYEGVAVRVTSPTTLIVLILFFPDPLKPSHFLGPFLQGIGNPRRDGGLQSLLHLRCCGR